MRTNFGIVAAATLAIAVMAAPTHAQQTSGSGGKTAAWTAVGAGAGFGLGLWAGLTAFDDAINGDRKAWTSAIVGAAAGGTLSYLLSRSRRQPAPGRSHAVRRASRAAPPALTDRDISALAASVTLR